MTLTVTILFLEDYNEVIYAAYRTALKLLHIRNNLHCKIRPHLSPYHILYWAHLLTGGRGGVRGGVRGLPVRFSILCPLREMLMCVTILSQTLSHR